MSATNKESPHFITFKSRTRWISAMQFGGTPLEAVVQAIAQDRFAVCGQIKEEVVRVLSHKFGWEGERVRADLAFYWQGAHRVELQGTLVGVCRDPKDDPFSNARNEGRLSVSLRATAISCRLNPTAAFELSRPEST